MSKQTSEEKSSLRLSVFKVLILIWIIGATFSGLHNNYDQKRQCIENEGWLKGWLWCSTESQNSFGLNMLKGIMWPVHVFSFQTLKSDTESVSLSKK